MEMLKKIGVSCFGILILSGIPTMLIISFFEITNRFDEQLLVFITVSVILTSIFIGLMIDGQDSSLSEIKKLGWEIEEYRDKDKEKDKKISRLESKNERLLTSKEELSEYNQHLDEQLQELKGELEVLDREERDFRLQLDRERRRLEMTRGVDLKYSIEERIQNLEITEKNRKRVGQIEKELQGANEQKLQSLYTEVQKLGG